jgi:fatty acid-binding protein DegV
MYVEAIENTVKDGFDVLCLTPTKTLSPAFTRANAAASNVLARHPNRRIQVLDTGLIGGGIGVVAHAALASLSKNKETEDTLREVHYVIQHSQMYCYTEDLSQLVTTTIVPPITTWREKGTRDYSILSLKQGSLSLLAAIPSWGRGGDRILKLIRAQSRLNAVSALVQWSDDEKRTQEFIDALQQSVRCSPLLAARICPSLGAFFGRGAIMVSFYPQT